MILYFSGTGNSRYIASLFKKELDDEVISINEYLKYQKRSVFKSDKPYVFVMPVYAWKMPDIIEEWIEHGCFEGNQKIYVVLTCGQSTGKADILAKRFFHRKTNLKFMGLSSIQMPDNYIIMFDSPDIKEAKEMIKESSKKVNELSKIILEEKAFVQESKGILSVMQSTVVNMSFHKFFMKDKGFHVTDKCISCLRCQQLCPLNNITIVEGKPKWNGNCTHCMACINSCPVSAIEFKNMTKNKRRYYLSDDINYQ